MSIKSWILGGLTGAGLIYFLDPDKGKRRQASVRDQWKKFQSNTLSEAESIAKDSLNRARGSAIETIQHFSNESVSDEIVVARVRSELGHYVSQPRNVEITVTDGVVTLAGTVPADEVQPFVAKVRSMAGVKGVENHLKLRQSTEHHSESQTDPSTTKTQ
jgi:osmotically-inducible protein OsmY